MKEINYDPEGDILTVHFLDYAKQHAGLEITDNIVLYFDTVNEKPLEMILICYSRLVTYTRKNPLKLKLSKYPKRLQKIALKLIQQPPVSNFLELNASDTAAYHTVRVKKLVLEPKILEETV